ncbi:MAG: chondroitin lyase, partial [Calditrichaeota bacterium]
DQKSQNFGNRKEAEKVAAERHCFHAGGDVQVMSARSTKHYPGVQMQRTLFLVYQEKLTQPIVVDLFRVESTDEHSYDYPIHFHGQLITTNFKYQAALNIQKTLSDDHGYQHIWQTAHGKPEKSFSVTWLNANRYYSLIASDGSGTDVYFGRTGANDPNFNLKSEPLVVIRKKAKNHLFASVIEPHGFFNEAAEKSVQARPTVQNVQVIGSNDEVSIVEIRGKNIHWQIMTTNQAADESKKHKVTFGEKSYEWTGNYNFVDLNR